MARRRPAWSQGLWAYYDTERHRLTVELSSGAELSVSPQALGLANDADLAGVRVEGGGFDLYFPRIDEGAYIPDLCLFQVSEK